MGAVKSLMMDLQDHPAYWDGRSDCLRRHKDLSEKMTGKAKEAYKLGWRQAVEENMPDPS